MGSRLFVGNLSYSCSAEDLRRLFEPRWAVSDVRVVTDRETRRSRGFAFVELDSEASAAQAIEAMDGHELGGRALVVREAHERTAKPQRRRDDQRAQPTVEAVVRRGLLASRDTRRRPRIGEDRRWHAPSSAAGGWIAPDEEDGTSEKRDPGEPEL